MLSIRDLSVASSLVALDAGLSVWMRLGIHRALLWATARMVVQLVAVGFVLRFVFGAHSPWLTLLIVVLMTAIAAREAAARPSRKLTGGLTLAISAGGVGLATVLTAGLALTTAIRPHPWYDPRYAISLTGIILGSVLNASSLALDGVLGGVWRERPAIDSRLALGARWSEAVGPLRREAIRRALLPIVNQMSAAGLITLPGIMTGQILAGMDPMEAVKYQILLMFLLAGASALAAVTVSGLALARLTDTRERLRLDRLK
ncbi:MAG TPA: iron export ABC transporter permease subunit FetB [Caulobacteraceae bacterium]|nr:iron export ABC transporter permease subunit FetB [Caulobacteraceae bacterium]